MRRIGLIITALTLSLTAFSQGKYGATPEDSITCIEALALSKENMKIDPGMSLTYFRIAYNVCPKSSKIMYINGVKLYKNLAKKEADTTVKKAYLDTMFSIYDQRIEMFGQRGYVLGIKGQSMLSTKQDKELTFATLNEAFELTGDKTQSGTLVGIMFATINMEKMGKKTKEEVVTMFERTMAVCAINKDNPKNGAKYIKASEKIQNVVSPYLDCTVLVPLAAKNFEANKADLAWLKTTMRLLKRNKCYQTEEGASVFANVAEAYFALEPSADGADAIGKIFQNKKEFSNAIEWFSKAVEMSETNEEKAIFTFSIAKAYSYSKSFSKARSFALKAAGLKRGWGEPYILIGDCYAQSAKTCDDGKLGKYGAYWAAVDKYKKAKAVDASIARVANKKIASVSARFPKIQDIFAYAVKEGDPYKVACWINESTSVRQK